MAYNVRTRIIVEAASSNARPLRRKLMSNTVEERRVHYPRHCDSRDRLSYFERVQNLQQQPLGLVHREEGITAARSSKPIATYRTWRLTMESHSGKLPMRWR